MKAGTAYLQGTKAARDHLGAVLVLGLGKSGMSVARYVVDLLGTRVSRVFIAAGARSDASEQFLQSIACEGVDWAFGDDALEACEEQFDVCIASPGIPFWHDLYVAGQRCSHELMSEVEFSWRESAEDSLWVAITGTNGKTTTTSCCAHVLKSCGMQAAAVGNIGEVCLDAVIAGQTQVYVAEVSSYQLHSTRLFAPDVVVMLNITPDHVHWHKTFEAYAQAKLSVLDHWNDSDLAHGCPKTGRPVAIMDATNDVVRARVRAMRALSVDERGFDYIPLGTADGIQGDMRARCGAENAAFLEPDGTLCVAFDGAEHELAAADDLQIKGAHNASNALAAGAVAVVMGANDAAIAEALRAFAPLEHRIEPCGSVAGVECVNDSKATNVDATLKAFEAFPGKGVIALLGGDDKGTDLTDLAASALAHVRVAVCFGQAGPRFAQALETAAGGTREGFVVSAEHLEDALDAALEQACPGEVVLLSPACASFDEFHSFEERGEVFKRLVADRAQAEKA